MFSQTIAGNAVRACLLEASSFPKPGNAWPGKKTGGLDYADFVKAAKAIRKACELAAERGREVGKGKRKAKDVRLGELFFLAARDTVRKVERKTNVNAGIILLLVPLCTAFGMAGKEGRENKRKIKSGERNGERKIKNAVEKIVSSAAVSDSVGLFKAMGLLRPRVERKKIGELDLHADDSEKKLREKKTTLHEVLQASFGFVPAELLNGFEKSFKIARWLEEEKKKRKKQNKRKIVAQVFLRALAEWNDSLVELKGGKRKAEEVRRKAGEALEAGGVFSSEGMKQVMSLDEWLRARELNPGSNADVACAGIFIALMNGLKL